MQQSPQGAPGSVRCPASGPGARHADPGLSCPKALAALRRLQQRAGDSLLPLLFEKDAEQWEESFATSFAAGSYQNVSADTLQEQVGVQAPA